MPLYCSLSVNSLDILDLKITRMDRTPISDVKPDDVFEYKISVGEWPDDDKVPEVLEWREIGRVDHRYGNGAKKLTIKALALASEKLGD